MATDIGAVPEPSRQAPTLPEDFEWHKALDPAELPEGRVETVTVGRRSLAMAHYRGGYGALDNRCPHQGGPLGKGSIEKGWLRLPLARIRLLAVQRTAPAGIHRRPGQLPHRGA